MVDEDDVGVIERRNVPNARVGLDAYEVLRHFTCGLAKNPLYDSLPSRNLLRCVASE